jgi:DNA ligase D-like protein (predicted ligase)
MPKSNRATMTPSRRGVERTSIPTWVKPQLAALVKKAPDGPDWLHEIKLDGYRMHARLDAGRVKIITRRGNDWTQKYPAIANAVAGLPAQDAYLDGELCGVLPDGRTAFNLIQNAADTGGEALVFFLFDLLFLDGEEIRDLPLVDRKARLEAFLVGAPESLRYNDHQIGQGPAFHRLACEHGLEGIVSKRIDGRYEPDRRTWLKTKCLNREEFVVVGWSDPEGSRHRIGALLLGYYTPDGKLVYAGRAGTGMPDAELERLWRRLIRSRSPVCLSPLHHRAVAVSAHRWCCRRCIGCAQRWSLRSATPSGRLTVCSGTSFTWANARTSQPSRCADPNCEDASK